MRFTVHLQIHIYVKVAGNKAQKCCHPLQNTEIHKKQHKNNNNNYTINYK